MTDDNNIDNIVSLIKSQSSRNDPPTPSAPIEFYWHGEPDNRPPCAWLIDKMIPDQGVGLMSGQWGACKTFAAFDLTGSIITKLPFAGRDIIRPGGVMFIAAEGGVEVRSRLRGIEKKLSTTAFVEAAAGNVTDADLAHLPLTWCEEPVKFVVDDVFKRLQDAIEATNMRMLENFSVPLVLIIIDTMGASVDFKDSKEGSETQRVMNRLREISRKNNLFVLVVDHFGKNVEVGTRDSAVKEDAADLVLAMLCDRDVGGNISNTRMMVRKLRRGKSGTEFPFDLVEVPIGDAESTCFIKWKKERDDGGKTSKKEVWSKALRIFRSAVETTLVEHGRDLWPYGAEGPKVKAVTVEQARDEFVVAYPSDAEDPRARLSAKRSAFLRALKEARSRLLVCSREINDVDNLWMVRDDELEYRSRTGL